MRYVMVPVPREYVLDIMRWVLFRAPEDDDTMAGQMRDQGRIRRIVDDADEFRRALLIAIATATVEDRPLRINDAADEVGRRTPEVVAALRELNGEALGGGRDLVRVSNETAVGVHGVKGKVTFVSMRPDHARFIRAITKQTDAASA